MTSLRKSRPKLKDSCDQCANAKVKCGKGKPVCQRCLEKGHACVYSYSCRAGRHLVKGGRGSPSLGRTGTSSATSSPVFTYSFPTTTSAAHLDTHNSFTLSGSPNHSRSGSMTSVYTDPSYYSSSADHSTYQPMSYSISPPEQPARLHDLSANFPPLSHTRSDSHGLLSNPAPMCGHPASTLPCTSDPLPAGPTLEPQWSFSDLSSFNLESSNCIEQCIMIGNQACLSRLLATFNLRPGEASYLTDFSLSEPTSIITASNILNRALDSDNDPIAVNKAILDLAASTFACSCSSMDSKLQHLLVAIALNAMARYSTVAFGDEAYLASFFDCTPPSTRFQSVLDELYRVANFLDTLDRRLQTPRGPSLLRHSSTDSQNSVGTGIESTYPMAPMPGVPGLYHQPSSSSSVSSSSSGNASPELSMDPGFAFSAVELRRRLQVLRTDILNSMRSG